MKIKAFTLIEVLLTLALIGVVNALTIPYFYNEFQKNKWAITYKRSFAETFNVLSLVALDEDCAKSLTCTKLFDNGQTISTEKFGQAMVKHMSILKDCGITGGDCFSHKIRVGLNSPNEETLKETMADKIAFAGDEKFETGFYTFRTIRGVSYAVLSFGLQCLNEPNPMNEAYLQAYVKDYDSDDTSNNQMLSLCGFIVIDVNGDQRPNTWGRDVFGTWVTDKSVLGIYPFGGEYDNAFGGKCHFATEEQQDTRGCAAQLIKDGWKMLY